MYGVYCYITSIQHCALGVTDSQNICVEFKKLKNRLINESAIPCPDEFRPCQLPNSDIFQSIIESKGKNS